MCRACRATSPHAYLIGRPAVCYGVVLPVCPCVVSFSKVLEHRHIRLIADKSLASSSDTSDTPDFLVKCYRHPREDATRKLLRCNLSLCLRAPRHPSFICLRSGVGRCQMSTRCQWRIHQVRIAPSLVTASLNVGAALQGTEVSVQYETREPSTG